MHRFDDTRQSRAIDNKMILLDTALSKRHSEGRPIRVALVGAGFMGAGIVNQIVRYCPGIHLAVVANRTPSEGGCSLQGRRG